MLALIDVVYFLIFTVMIFSSVLWLIVYIINRGKVHLDPDNGYRPDVTFIIPAYNEEKYIGKTIESLLDQNYPEDKLRIIAVNDGSTDDTFEIMKQYEDRIDIIDKENSGKASSMNTALKQVKTEVVGCLDGDSFADPDMLKSMVPYMRDEGVKGVTPAMKVKEPGSWVEKVIWAEYIYQVFLRKLFAIFDSQYVMPGPGSIYDTEMLREMGGWDEDTLTEDMEIAFRMHRKGVKIENSSNAYVETVSPESLKGLYRQRVRWYRGYIRNFFRYRDMVFNTRYGNLGLFLLPFNMVWNVIVVFILGHFLYNMATGILQSYYTYQLVGFIPPSMSLSIQSLSMFHIFYTWFLLIGIANLLLSIKTAGEDVKLWKRKTHYVLFLWIYSFLYAGFWVAAALEEIRGGARRW
ncbi:MAG: glycosyltransferase family 2 protein [Candidatus Nanohaloarchaea archaeon]